MDVLLLHLKKGQSLVNIGSYMQHVHRIQVKSWEAKTVTDKKEVYLSLKSICFVKTQVSQFYI